MTAIATKYAKRPPAHFVDGMMEFVRAGVYSIKSATVSYNSDSPAELFKVEANTLVVDLIVNVATAFGGTTPSVTLGDGDDADGFMDNTAFAPATEGWKSMKQDTQPYSGGKLYTAADTIDATIAITDTVAGSFTVWLVYRVFAEEEYRA